MAEQAEEVLLEAGQALTLAFCEFLTVSVHCILFERNIYPSETFLSARKYNCAVRQNRNPDVCTWINDAIAAVQVELLKGTVDRVALVIFSSQAVPLERFLFDISDLPAISPEHDLSDVDQAAGPEDRLEREVITEALLVDVEEQFRATVMKISSCGSSLAPLPGGCTFTISVELKARADPPIGHPQPWIPSQPSLQRTAKGQQVQKGADLKDVTTTPLRAVEAGTFKMECWVQESNAKFRQETLG